MSQPTISVVMPAYNAAKFITDSIQSALNQTLPVTEIVVVDDGSRDNTAEVAAACGDKVRVIRQTNGGPAAARNRGIQEARCEWIAFLDSDDSWAPNKIERQAPAMIDGVSLIHAYCVVDETGPLTPDDLNFEKLWNQNTLGTSTVVVRKSACDDVGGFDPDRSLIGAEDYNFWLRLLLKGHKFHTIRERLVNYTPAPGNISSQHEKMVVGELRNIDKIGELARLTPDQIRTKQVKIYEEWGRALFHSRAMRHARNCYSQILAREVKLSALIRWAATYVPVPVLNLRRRNVPAC